MADVYLNKDLQLLQNFSCFLNKFTGYILSDVYLTLEIDNVNIAWYMDTFALTISKYVYKMVIIMAKEYMDLNELEIINYTLSAESCVFYDDLLFFRHGMFVSINIRLCT